MDADESPCYRSVRSIVYGECMGWTRFLRRRYWDEERRRELESYLDFETAENLARGMPGKQARLAARRKLGNTALTREEIYRMNSIGFLEAVFQDARYAGRVMRRSPAFTIVAVLSLALGIGANTAIFSVIHAVLLRALPYPDPGKLVLLRGPNAAITIPEFEFWREHSRSFGAVAGYRGGGERRLIAARETQWVTTMTITADFFRVLGVNPALGREFNADETHAGGPQAVVLTDALWRRSFGADPGILGRAVLLDSGTFTVVGVLPAGFWFPQRAAAFVPLRPTGNLGDTGTNTMVIGRLKPGVELRQANVEMRLLTEAFRREKRQSDKYIGLTVTAFQQYLVGDVRLNLLLLFGAVGLLLLIACANLTSLLLTRLAGRWKEIAVRLALGSGSGRLFRQFLMENLLLAAMGSAAGLALGYLLLEALMALIPFDLPSSTPVRLDGTVLLFTVGIGAAATVVFTLVPFLSSARLNLHESLKAGGRSSAEGPRRRTRSVLVVGEVALSVALLISAGLLIQTLYRLHQEQLGFNPEGIITFETPPGPEIRTTADLTNFERALMERIQAIPGVLSVAATSVLPLDGWGNLPTQRDGHPEQSIGGMEIRTISPGYFATMGIPIRRGRLFTTTDTAGSPPVALVNETLARTWWPNGGAVGDRLVIGRFRGRDLLKDPAREVVGIVADTKTSFLKDPPKPTVYVAVPQSGDGLSRRCVWVVRAGGSAGVAAALRRAVSEFDPQQRIKAFRTMNEVVASTTAGSRFDAWLFAVFAGVALLLTAVGVYGLLSFTVAQRRREIGTRMALGASRGDVIRLILRHGLALAAIGLAVGLAGALALTRSLADLLYGVKPNDPLSYVAVSVLLLAVALAAGLIPARRATRIDPITALRYE